jgi:hypothetical protein
MPHEVALSWFEGICAAVAYLHDHGIVHRDLKPANIFIDDNVIKIGDYGLSKFISCSRRSGQTESVGTVHYMAPEIANGRYGREIDAYALGIILYEMLTGRVPFEGESVGEVLMKHLTAEPNLEKLSEPFLTVVKGAMAKDPERRINNAAEMMARLRGASSPVAAAASPAGIWEAKAPATADSRQTDRRSQRKSFRPERLATLSRLRAEEGFASFFHRDPEPVWAATKAGWFAMRKDLNYDAWTVTGRIAFAVFCTIVIVMMWPIWFSLGAMAAFVYVPYRVIRVFVRAATDAPGLTHSPNSASPQSVREDASGGVTPVNTVAGGEPMRPAGVHHAAFHGTGAPWKRRGHTGWRQAAHAELLGRPVRDRASSVVGSMLAAGVVAPVASLLACMVFAPDLPVELVLWTATVATVASWALMIPGQLAEARMEDHAPLRFINLLLGAVVGLAAWAVAQSLYLDIPSSADFAPGPWDTLSAQLFSQRYEGLHQAYMDGAVQMPPAMYAAYFAFFFLVLRWWRLSESTRSARVSLWLTAWTAFIGWAMTFFWWFPQPMGLMLAGVIAFTVQLSSPWLSPSRRRELAQRAA